MHKQKLLATLMASAAFAFPAMAQQETTNIGEIKVQQRGSEGQPGGGYIIPEDSPKERSTVTTEAIEHQPASSNVFQLINRLPGVNAQATDATGLFGGQLSIRGFNSDEIGFSIDGVPLNDSGNGAIFPQEYVDTENMQEIGVTQGAPDADQAQAYSVGASVTLIPKDPADKFNIQIVQSAGQLDFFKSFVRVDSGNILGTGLKSFISYSKAQADKFKGPGFADRDHIDFGTTYEFGNGSKISLFSIYNDAVNNNIQTASFAQLGQFGRGFDFESRYPGNLPGGPGAENENTAPAGFPSDYPGFTYNRNNYYKLRVNPFKNEIAYLKADINVLDNLHVTVQPYYWNGYGNGGGTAYLNEGNVHGYTLLGKPVPGAKIDLNGDGDTLDNLLYYNPSITSTQRPGVNFKIVYQPIDWDLIRVGINYDHARHHQTAPYSRVNNDGTPISVWGDSGDLTFANGTLVQRRDQLTFNDQTVAYFENTLKLLNDSLEVVTGIKRQETDRSGNNYLPEALATGNNMIIHPEIDYVNYLPELQIGYKIAPEHQVYFNLQKNARVPSNFTLYESAAISTNAAVLGSQVQQTAWNLDLGYRFQTEDIYLTVDLFATNFQHRQLQFRTGQDVVDATNYNIGGTHNRGVEAEIGTAKPINGWTVYGSLTYNRSVITSDLPIAAPNGTLLLNIPTQGKAYPNTPRFMLSADFEYEPPSLPGVFIGVSPKYTGSRYSTLVNDERMGSYTEVNLFAGYHVPDGWLGPLHDTTVQFNVENLFDRDYVFIGYGNSSSGTSTKPLTLINPATGKPVTISATTPFYNLGAPRFFSVKLTTNF